MSIFPACLMVLFEFWAAAVMSSSEWYKTLIGCTYNLLSFSLLFLLYWAFGMLIWFSDDSEVNKKWHNNHWFPLKWNQRSVWEVLAPVTFLSFSINPAILCLTLHFQNVNYNKIPKSPFCCNSILPTFWWFLIFTYCYFFLF